MPFHAVAMAVSLLVGQPVGHSYDPCLSSEECSDDGRCSSFGGQCVVMSNADCARSELCKEKGRCTAFENDCVAGSDFDCQASLNCRKEGVCYKKPDEPVCDRGTQDTDRGLKIGGLVMVGVGGAGAAAGLVLIFMQS